MIGTVRLMSYRIARWFARDCCLPLIRCFHIPSWRQQEVEKALATVFILIIFSVLGFFTLVGVADIEKDITEIDLSEDRQNQLINDFIKHKQNQLQENYDYENDVEIHRDQHDVVHDHYENNHKDDENVQIAQHELRHKVGHHAEAMDVDDNKDQEVALRELKHKVGAGYHGNIVEPDRPQAGDGSRDQQFGGNPKIRGPNQITKKRNHVSKEDRRNKMAAVLDVFRTVRKEILYEDNGKADIRLYDLGKGVDESYECVMLNVTPVTPVCLYPAPRDVHISRAIREEGTWEPHIVRQVQQILGQNPGMGLIDVGANIGVYSLISANMGHQVLAIEPLTENIQHLQMAAKMANVTQRITVVQNILSDRRGAVSLNVPQDNQGGGAVKRAEKCLNPPCSTQVEAIYLDDLCDLDIPFDTAVMKVDVEGHENRVFRRATRLLNKIFVPYIFMEWLKLRSYYGAEITQSEDKDLTFELIDFLEGRGYTAHCSVTGAALEATYWYGWSHDIIWKHELQEFI